MRYGTHVWVASRSMAETSSAQLTVEQLAHETGMSVRNIRNHQSRGLLPPPEVRARTGYYGPEHVDRLRLIQEMQAEGFKLSAIERFIGDRAGSASGFLDLRRALQYPYETEAPEILTTAELAERFGPVADQEKNLAKAVKLGLLVPIGDDRYEAPNPALMRAAEEVVRRGVPLSAALQVMERVRESAEKTSRAFVRLFLQEVWKPFDEAGRPEERWGEVTESIERLRPLAAEALLAVFRQTLAEEAEQAFGRVLARER